MIIILLASLFQKSRVTYGNVGSRTRLDFTVIGQAANIAARLCDYAKTARIGIVATQEAAQDSDATRDLGTIDLHNVMAAVNAFAVSDQTSQRM